MSKIVRSMFYCLPRTESVVINVIGNVNFDQMACRFGVICSDMGRNDTRPCQIDIAKSDITGMML